MKHFKYYDFYQEYIGQKCDYSKFKIRILNGHPPEVAIYPGRLNELTRGYTIDDKIEEEKDLKSRIAKIKQQLYKNQELKELRRKLKVVRSTILNIKKNKHFLVTKRMGTMGDCRKRTDTMEKSKGI